VVRAPRKPTERTRGAIGTAASRAPEPSPASGPSASLPADLRLSDVDEWGRSERVRTLVRRIYGPVYSRWFRVEWEDIDKIPRAGGALLVGNHAGAIPSDAPVIMHGVETELGRPVYGLTDYFFRSLPIVSTLWSRAGGVPAHPDNAYRLLHDERELALVFPEGEKGPSKPYAQRYRLQRFGRGGFVEIAMRAGVPIVPIVVVGSEETMPLLWQIPQLTRMLKVPYLPLTANMVLLGPLGLAVPFPAKFRLRVLDPVTFDAEPGRARYPKSRVLEESERIRESMQHALDDMLRNRRSIWFG
jgi:1-acyl-sn-glycerol-3-phosphate acyltransferase